MAIRQLPCLLRPAGFTLDTLLLSAVLPLRAVLLLNAHPLHLLPARIAFRSLLAAILLTAVLSAPPRLALLGLLCGLLSACVHLVHSLLPASVPLVVPLLAACFVLLAYLLHHLLTLLAAVGSGLLLRSLPFSSFTTAAPILALRRTCLTRLSATPAVTALLALDLPFLALRATAITAPAALGRLTASTTSTVPSAAAFALAERVGLRADEDRERSEHGE